MAGSPLLKSAKLRADEIVHFSFQFAHEYDREYGSPGYSRSFLPQDEFRRILMDKAMNSIPNCNKDDAYRVAISAEKILETMGITVKVAVSEESRQMNMEVNALDPQRDIGERGTGEQSPANAMADEGFEEPDKNYWHPFGLGMGTEPESVRYGSKHTNHNVKKAGKSASSQNETHKQIVEEGGGKYIANQDGFVYFDSPTTYSTLLMKESVITPELVRQKIQTSDALFAEKSKSKNVRGMDEGFSREAGEPQGVLARAAQHSAKKASDLATAPLRPEVVSPRTGNWKLYAWAPGTVQFGQLGEIKRPAPKGQVWYVGDKIKGLNVVNENWGPLSHQQENQLLERGALDLPDVILRLTAVDYYANPIKKGKPESEKRSHEEVSYESPSKHPGQSCAGCRWFITPDACTSVQKPIKAKDWCEKFDSKKKGFTSALLQIGAAIRGDEAVDFYQPTQSLPPRYDQRTHIDENQIDNPVVDDRQEQKKKLEGPTPATGHVPLRQELAQRSLVGATRLFATAKPKCPHCGSSDYGLMPTDFETAKCNQCGKNWHHGIVPGINDPFEKKASDDDEYWLDLVAEREATAKKRFLESPDYQQIAQDNGWTPEQAWEELGTNYANELYNPRNRFVAKVAHDANRSNPEAYNEVEAVRANLNYLITGEHWRNLSSGLQTKLRDIYAELESMSKGWNGLTGEAPEHSTYEEPRREGQQLPE